MTSTAMNRIETFVIQHEEYQEARTRLAPLLGTLVRECRREMKYSQRKLAATLHVNHTYLSKIENGHTTVSPDVLRRLVDVCREAQAR